MQLLSQSLKLKQTNICILYTFDLKAKFLKKQQKSFASNAFQRPCTSLLIHL